MRLIYFIRDLHTIGGIERVTVNKANWLAEHGYDVHIITTDQSGECVSFALSDKVNLMDLGLNYTRNKGRNWFYKGFRLISNHHKHKIHLKKVIKRINPDIIVSTFGPEMGILAKSNLCCPKILEFHSAIVQFENMKRAKGLRGLINRLNYNSIYNYISKFDRFVILDENEKNKWHRDNIISIPNPCMINGEPSILEAKIVNAVGRLSAEKDFISMIEAWALVSHKHPDWQLRIYGTGPDKEKILNLITEKGLERSVTLMGYTDDVAKSHREASIFMMTSLYEGMPMSLIEAQSSGLPSVVFETDGRMKSFVEDEKSGYVIDNRDRKKLAQAVCRLIEDIELRKAMGAKAVKIKEKYSELSIMSQWTMLFDSLTN